MGTLYRGTAVPDAIYRGAASVDAVYRGAEKVWPPVVVELLVWTMKSGTSAGRNNPGQMHVRNSNQIEMNKVNVDGVTVAAGDMPTLPGQVSFTCQTDAAVITATVGNPLGDGGAYWQLQGIEEDAATIGLDAHVDHDLVLSTYP